MAKLTPVRRAKIVATLGPSTDSLERVIGLIEAGVNVARLNMSHGDHKEHMRRLKLVRDASYEVGRPVGVFADLQGPKIRLTKFENDFAILLPGQRFVITTDDVLGTAERAGTTLKTLTEDVRPGDEILIDDGKLRLRAVEVTDTEVVTEVEVGGRVDVASRPDATVDRRTRTVPTDPVPVTNRFDHGLPALMVTACEGSA